MSPDSLKLLASIAAAVLSAMAAVFVKELLERSGLTAITRSRHNPPLSAIRAQTHCFSSALLGKTLVLPCF